MDRLITGHHAGVWSAAVGRLGQRDVIVSGSTDGTVGIWDQNGRPVGGRPRHGDGVMSVALGRSVGQDIVVSASRTIRIWDQDGRRIGGPLIGHDDDVCSLAVCHLAGQEVIVSAGIDTTIRVWDIVRSCEVAQINHVDHVDPVRSFSIASANQLVVATGSALCAWRLTGNWAT